MKVSILIKVSKVAQSKIEDHKERQPHNVKKVIKILEVYLEK